MAAESFAILGRVQVTHPKSVSWRAGRTRAIRWRHNYPAGAAPLFDVTIDRDGDGVCNGAGDAPGVLATGVPGDPSPASLSWLVSGAGNLNRVCVAAVGDPDGHDVSEAFEIRP